MEIKGVDSVVVAREIGTILRKFICTSKKRFKENSLIIDKIIINYNIKISLKHQRYYILANKM